MVFNFIVIVVILGGSIFSAYHAVNTVKPRTDSPTDHANKYKSLIFYGDVASFSIGEYYNGVKKQTEEDVVRDCAYQAHALACILNDKFTALKEATTIQMKWVVRPAGVLLAVWVLGVVLKLAGHIHP
jgi:hypothetical protein